MLCIAETQTEQVSVGLYNDILAGILMGDYPLKTRLPTETRLAKDYGVSRTVVRSALDLLKREGVVQSRQGSGTVVVEIDPQTVARLNRDAQMPTLKDCYACRLAIEPAIASSVAQDLSQEACAFLEEQRIVLDNNEEGDAYERSARDVQFHIHLAKFSGNTFFIAVMKTLRPHMLFAMNISKTLSNCAQRHHVNLSRKEHLSTISAILGRDPEAAHDAMFSHIKKGAERIFSRKPPR